MYVCMQVFYNASDDQSYMDYDNAEIEASQGSFVHDVSEVQYESNWARFR